MPRSKARNDAARRWAEALAEWAVPREILDAAPQRPFVFNPKMFAAPTPGDEVSGSTGRAAEALPPGGSVLDVGCGGGAAAFALVPPAGELIGTDRQQDMLDLFLETARERAVPASVVCGPWLSVEAEVPLADVVVCHNVLYNVPDIAEFVTALNAHARRRVVIEITHHHPQTVRKPLWKHFWDLDRPSTPTAAMAAEAVRSAGFDVQIEDTAATKRDDGRSLAVEAAFWCRQLCLPEDRVDEVAEMLENTSFPRERATLWWDVSR